jgi:hypothetical protein
MIATLALYGAGVLALGWLALRPLHLPPLSRRVELGALAAGFGLPVLMALLPEVPTASSSGFNYPGWTYYCFVDGGGVALATFLLVRVLDRGSLPSTGAALAAAAAAGLAGLIGLQLQCPVNYPMHLLTGHATVPIGVAVVYLLVRRT